jgi:hypothetical protein
VGIEIGGMTPDSDAKTPSPKAGRQASGPGQRGTASPNADIKELVIAGRIAEAVELYRSRYGVETSRAEDAIQAWSEAIRLGADPAVRAGAAGPPEGGGRAEPPPKRRWWQRK